MILALDLATAVRRIEINTTELAPNGHQSIQIEDHEIHKEFTSNIQVNYTDPMHNQQVNNKRSISLQGRNKHSTSILEAQSTRHQFQPQYLPGDIINYFVKNSLSPSEYQVSTPSEDHELPRVHGWPTANVMVPDTPKKTQNNSLPTSGLAATICTTYRNADEAGELTGMVLRELMRPLLPIMWSRALLMCWRRVHKGPYKYMDIRDTGFTKAWPLHRMWVYSQCTYMQIVHHLMACNIQYKSTKNKVHTILTRSVLTCMSNNCAHFVNICTKLVDLRFL